MVTTFSQTGEITPQMKAILKYLSLHVGAYARERNARADGMGYRAEWVVIDPDKDYAVVGKGAAEQEAWDNAIQNA